MSPQTITSITGADPAPRSLHGAHASALQRQLFLLWHQADATQLKVLIGTEMASALVHMRRTGRAQYDARDHARIAAQEERRLPAHAARAAQRLAFPPGTPVRVLGEPHTGIITHPFLGHDYDSPYPAVWYVVAVLRWRVCRAHGADEIEEQPSLQGHGRPTIRPSTSS
jgi:hypothetical protein